MIAGLEKGLFWIDWLISRAAAVVILLVMVSIGTDVAARYLFNSPLSWVYDFVSIYAMNIVLYLMASEVLRTQSHVELDLKVRLLPERAWNILGAVSWIAVAAALAVIAGLAYASMLASWRMGEVHPGLYEWPIWIEKAVVAVGLTLLCLRILVRWVRFVQCNWDTSVFNADESGEAKRH